MRSDTLVFFGATGDLAHRKIFPAVHELVRTGRLTVPVIAVARGNHRDGEAAGADQLVDEIGRAHV